MAQDKDSRQVARQVRQWPIAELYERFSAAGVTRAFIVYENGVFTLSHPALLAPLQAWLELSQAFAQHEGIFIGREAGLETLFFAFVHDTRRGLAQGGLRFCHYDNVAELLEDGLRLSQGMTRKNALAGLWWGGGKGIMTLPPGLSHPTQLATGPDRARYFEAYGRFVASLGGLYYTAEDVGTTTPDMNSILRANRFTTCISQDHGGSGNPSPFTAWGVLRAMQAAWLVLTGKESLEGVKVAVQGTGNVGQPLIRYLDEAGAELWICDINAESVAALVSERPHLHAVAPEQIFDLAADIFAPCARGAQVNAETIPRLKVRLVCGAANNILREPETDAERLRTRGIAFVPDYVCNRMGIVNCADEWQGYLAEDIRTAAERVFPDTLRVFKYARSRSSTTSQATRDLADIAACELHPLQGHRGRRLIDHLLHSGWHLPPQSRQFSRPPKTELAFVPVLDEPYIRLSWEREDSSPALSPFALAATPISAGAAPSLDSFISPLLLDIRARSLAQAGITPRRMLGADHGGLSLQVAVERNSPYEREEMGRAKFVEMCQDLFSRHDALIREQLHQLGIRFDPRAWLDPLGKAGKGAVRRLYAFLRDARLVSQASALAYHCPRCQTVLVASELSRSKLAVKQAYTFAFLTDQGQITASLYFPEFILGAAGLAVHPQGRFASCIGQSVVNPANGEVLPVIASASIPTDAEIVVPLVSRLHTQIASSHQLTNPQQLFDKDGYFQVPAYQGLSQEEARQAILEKCAGQFEVQQGNWEIAVLRCQRCEALVIPRYSDQLFVQIGEGVKLLTQAIQEERVTFSHPHWRARALEYLRTWELWCISRQYWWGNEIPDSDSGDVFSVWFSLAAWTLAGAGWPENPKPAPLDEVFVDTDFLYRWAIPAQIIALIVTGRPVFQHMHIHGSLHVIEQVLRPRPAAPEGSSLPDEERFLSSTIRRPMRQSLRNLIDPATFIRRFGSDALRLGCVLAIDSASQEVITASESRFRQARHALHRLLSKVTGIVSMVRPPLFCGEARLADCWILARCQAVTQASLPAYQEARFNEAGHLFVSLIRDFAQYANLVAQRRQDGDDMGAVRATVAEVIVQMQTAFSPLCPYIFEKLKDWTRRQCLPAEQAPPAWVWLDELVEALRQQAEPVEVGTPDQELLAWLLTRQDELQRLVKVPLNLSAAPSAGQASFHGRFVLVRPGPYAPPLGNGEAEAWYGQLHLAPSPA